MLRLNNKFTPLKFTQNLPTKKVDEEEPEKNNSNNESVSNTTNNTPSKNVDLLGNYKNLQEYLNTVPVNITFVAPEETPTVDSSEDADGVQAPETPADEEPEKTKPTIQNLQDLYGIYRPAIIEIKTTFHGYLLMDDLNKTLQDYIDNNNLDISLDNLKLFFSDVMNKQPSGGMAGSQYLVKRFNDYIENGYTTSLEAERDTLSSQVDELYKDYQDALANGTDIPEEDTEETPAIDTPENTEEVQTPETPANDEPKKTETTIQNLQDLYGTYRTGIIKFKTNPIHGSSQIIEKMNESLKKYIDDNNLDISLENLKSFFSDVMNKQPSGAMAGAQYLIKRFDDYIKNGYTPSFATERDTLSSQVDELYKDYLGALDNSDSEAPETPENPAISATPTTPGQTPPTQEELDGIQNVVNDNLNKTFGIFSDDEDTPETPSAKTTTELFDEITPSKPELREYISNIMDNFNDMVEGDKRLYDFFSERELDTFVDSIISQVVKNSNNQNVETLLSEIKTAISDALTEDILAPMNINKSLMATDDYLLSDEEKKLKADLVDVEFDSDPTDIDGSGFDYSVMSNAEDKVADLTADWDISDIDSALNCKSPYTGAYSKNSSTITLYKNLEQLKPQLKAYIKEQLSAQGREYDEQTVEKYLNYYITETVRESIQAKYHDKLPELYPDTVLSADATLQDLGEYLVTKVKDEIAEGNTSFGSTWSTSGFDPLLNSTSDYFLTPEEIAQKKQMNNKKSGI